MLLEELAQPVPGGSWRCSRCGESLEPQFAACWNCGAMR
jgi:hypothetical protein